ncbi:MAG: alpha-L-fucosidase [Firmicutes bacterium]|nr:alpha-L-fucosidase [Bacillota bacterium]
MQQSDNIWRIKIDRDRTTHLYAVSTVDIIGNLKKDMSNTQIRWYGPGYVVWEIELEEDGDYEVAICYASFSEGIVYNVFSGSYNIQGITRRTKGYFQTTEHLLNFEREYLKGKISLTKGTNRITFSITESVDNYDFSLSSIELTPVKAKAAIEKDKNLAAGSLACTDWFVNAGYGLMFHWTAQSQPRHGKLKPYRDAVMDFNVKAFADMVELTGAGYIIFTANHAKPHFPAPIQSWERLYPGWTTERDLIAELASALASKNVRLMLYLNPFAAYVSSPRLKNIDGSTFYRDEVRMDMSCKDDYIETTCEVLREIGLRYKKAIAGYWFDSCYQPYMHFGSFPIEVLFRAAKEGNSERICAFNYWILPVNTLYQEYWAGEVGGIGEIMKSRYIENGAGKGLQSHALIIMDDPWVHKKPETEVEDPHYNAETLISYIKGCMKNGGVITMNLGIYQDGSIGDKTLEVMKEIKKAIRA